MTEFGEGTHPLAPARQTTKVPVRLRISLFFDGTLNNRANVQLREQDARRAREIGGEDSSFDGELTNVARLEMQLDDSAAGYDHYIAIYVEGAGTTNHEGDSLWGYATGQGATGVEAKVSRGLNFAVSRIAQLRLSRRRYEFREVTVDTCGFSRGAASARHCVHRVLRGGAEALQRRIEGLGYTVGAVTVQAVGLFDTVSSHGELYYGNDTDALNLDAIREARAVFQVAASEEYRSNFSLWNIASAQSGRQVYVPGAHSDVGGGYRDGFPERWTLYRGAASDEIAQFLLDRGWYQGGRNGPELVYRPSELPPAYGTGYEAPPTPAQVTGQRRSISYRYSFIPLRFMADFLRDQQVPVKQELYDRHDPRGVPGRERVERDVASGRATRPEHWERPHDAELARLRHGYLHVSFREQTGHGVRLGRNNRPTRRVYTG